MSRSTTGLRNLDRWIGVPLVCIGGGMRRPRSVPLLPKVIGFMQPTAIGDLILSSGTIAHLAATFPQARRIMFLSPSNAAAAELLADNVETRVFDFRNPVSLVHMLRSEPLDVLIDQCPWPNLTALAALLSGAAFTVGFTPPGGYRGAAFDRAVPYRFDRHDIDNHRAIAAIFGTLNCRNYALKSVFPSPQIDLPWSEVVVAHLSPGGSRATEKSWPVAHWGELARRITQRGYMIAFTGTTANRAQAEAVIHAAALPTHSYKMLCGILNLQELGSLLQRVRAVISVDTSVMHFAAALNTPLLGLFGPSRILRHGPRGKHSRAVASPHVASGFINLGFETHPAGLEVMAALSVKMVWDEFMALLSETPERAVAQ